MVLMNITFKAIVNAAHALPEGQADSNEIRLYNSGEGYEVECATCHDPHGVPSGGPGSIFNPTFLRVSNVGSGVCLSCHTK